MEIEVTKMTTRGQVVIPQNIRDEKDLKEGERFLVYELDDSIVLKRIKNMKAKSIDEFERTFSQMWQEAKKSGATKKDVEEEIRKHRQNA